MVDLKEVRKFRSEEEGRVKKLKLMGFEWESKRRKFEEDIVVEGEGRLLWVFCKIGLEKGMKSGGVLVVEVVMDGCYFYYYWIGFEW